MLKLKLVVKGIQMWVSNYDLNFKLMGVGVVGRTKKYNVMKIMFRQWWEQTVAKR